MTAFLIKSNLAIAGIYILYRLLLWNENSPTLKRFFLLAGLAISLSLPFIHIRVAPVQRVTDNLTTVIERVTPSIDTGIINLTGAGSDVTGPFKNWLLWLYLIPIIIMLARYITNITRLIRTGSRLRQEVCPGYNIAVMQESVAPFSFWKTIYVSNNDYLDGYLNTDILRHELVHIRRKHTIDVLTIEMLQCLFWFNPLVWLYKKAIRENHEYEADLDVLRSGSPTGDYMQLLLNNIFRNNNPYMASRFNYSSVKKRFVMMTKERSAKRIGLKLAVLLPVTATVLMSIACAKIKEPSGDLSSEWWYPIAKAHNIPIGSYNVYDEVGMWETGTTNSVIDGVSYLTDGIIICRDMGEDSEISYSIMKGKTIEHDILTHNVKITEASYRVFKHDSGGEALEMIGDEMTFSLYMEIPPSR
ncbi:MAG: M56 family metallopeptidase [Alistipes sp.]|nr:M56 family metallopeptidase [Alistipes sp.]